MNFNKEFGDPKSDHYLSYGRKIHRFKYPGHRTIAQCNGRLTLYTIWTKNQMQFSNICKKCLNTFSAEEIEDLKYWLILKKLGVSV